MTTRDFCFLAFRDNGNLRRSSFLTVGANCLQDFLVRDFADLFSRLGQRLASTEPLLSEVLLASEKYSIPPSCANPRRALMRHPPALRMTIEAL